MQDLPVQRQIDIAIANDDGADLKRLEASRWPNGPKICAVANLPYFKSEAEAKAWHTRHLDGNPIYEPNPIVKMWRCAACGGVHFLTKMRPPSGSSSGSSKR